MSNWLRTLIRKGAEEANAPAVELLVLEGADTGQQFTVDGDEVMVGRRLPSGRGQRGIILRDPTVSAKQAMIRRRGQDYVIQHLAGATNPTLVDGNEAHGAQLRPNARIQMGRILMEVRERTGVALSDLTQILVPGSTESAGNQQESVPHTEVNVAPDADLAETETTQMRPAVSERGCLIVERGFDLVSEKRFPIWSTRTTIGRSKESDVRISDIGISRTHAELVNEDGKLRLLHRSKVNPTLLNGCEVLDHELVHEGDLIQLAESVVLRVELAGSGERGATPPNDAARRSTLRQQMEEKIELDRLIEEKYSVEGSFLDVDIVNSYGMKVQTTRAEHIIVSFERFRAYVAEIVGEFDGLVLNSNGDELMCFFTSTYHAVKAGSEILARLDEFNTSQNLLRASFRFRIGIHTGKSLVDLDQGVAYSAVLDVAGHLQKLAEVNGLVISQQTYEAMPEGLPFEHAGTMEREGLEYYRLTARIE